MSCKLYLVPEDVIQTWRQSQRQDKMDNPEATVLNNMDRSMQSVLKNQKLDDYDKEKLYTQQLGKFMQMRKSQKPSLPPDIIQSVPKLYQAKAQAFLKYIHSDPDIAWDDRGQLILKGKTISKSHIVDLLHDALRARKKVKRPQGWQEMSGHLREKNIPQELIGNETWSTSPSKLSSALKDKKPKISLESESWSTPASSPPPSSPKLSSVLKHKKPKLSYRVGKPRQSKQRAKEKIRDWISL